MTTDTEPLRAQLERLQVGASFSRAVRYDGNLPGLKDMTRGALATMRSALQPAITRASKKNRHYTMEQVEGRTASRDLIIVIVVTRMN